MRRDTRPPHRDLGSTVSRGTEEVRSQREAVRSMFNIVSPRYDLLNRLLSLGLDGSWRRRAVREMRLGPADHVLDVACGTGDLALEAARTPGLGRVVGVDFATGMLEIARGKTARPEPGGQVLFATGAAESLPFRSGAFGAAGIAFGIRNVPDRIAAIREMARVVRSGGRVVVLELTTTRGVTRSFTNLYVRLMLPLLGGLLSRKEAYRYLSESMRSFPEPGAFLEEMRSAGLEDVSAARMTPSPAWIFTGRVVGAPAGGLG